LSRTIQAVRGMHDVLPDQSLCWQNMEDVLRQVMRIYSFEELRMPIVEKTELFVRTIGEVTDIVEKEMYSFNDRNQESLSLRPEGTAGCVRACIEHGLIYNKPRQIWYMGPMFRHERPQKGRYRQFHQAGAEAFGMPGPDIDAILICMTARLWQMLGIEGLVLQINSLGSIEARANYRKYLLEYLHDKVNDLDDESRTRLDTNPFRILDSKKPDMQPIIQAAPVVLEYLDEPSRKHFDQLKSLLDTVGIKYQINPHLMRGLDYYEKTVFEWVSDRLGAQSAVCAGGRYDGLVKQLGGRSTPAVGFALGCERILALINKDESHYATHRPLVYFVLVGNQAIIQGLLLSEMLHDKYGSINIQINCGGGSFKSQLKKADGSGARIALIIGEDEAVKNEISIKLLRENQPQETILQSSVEEYLAKMI